jgi:hypothetical protein
MPITWLKLFEFLTQHLAHFPSWCQRLALVKDGGVGEADRLAPREGDKKIWQDMCADLHTILAQEQTLQEFLAYLVDAKRARGVESPVSRP